MAIIIKSVLAVILGTMIGLALTSLSIERGFSFGALRAGPWIGSKTGAPDIDPYARALIARSGLIPLGAGEGMAFTARTDTAGEPIEPSCDYVMQGPMPPARYWTVSVFSPSGNLIENADKRYGFTSSEVVRDMDHPVEIVLAPEARPGNWLPTPLRQSYVVVLRLYDSVLSATAASTDSTPMPKLIRSTCR